MDARRDIDFNALTDELQTRLQLLQYRTQRLRSWRALHRQAWKTRRLQRRRLFQPEALHRAAVIVATGDEDLTPIGVN